MIVFLKGRKLWRYVTDSIPKLVPIPQSKATIDANSSKTRAAWTWLHMRPKLLLLLFFFFTESLKCTVVEEEENKKK